MAGVDYLQVRVGCPACEQIKEVVWLSGCVRSLPRQHGEGGGALRDPETRAEVGESEQATNFFRIVLALGRLFQRQS